MRGRQSPWQEPCPAFARVRRPAGTASSMVVPGCGLDHRPSHKCAHTYIFMPRLQKDIILDKISRMKYMQLQRELQDVIHSKIIRTCTHLYSIYHPLDPRRRPIQFLRYVQSFICIRVDYTVYLRRVRLNALVTIASSSSSVSAISSISNASN